MEGMKRGDQGHQTGSEAWSHWLSDKEERRTDRRTCLLAGETHSVPVKNGQDVDSIVRCAAAATAVNSISFSAL